MDEVCEAQIHLMMVAMDDGGHDYVDMNGQLPVPLMQLVQSWQVAGRYRVLRWRYW